MEWIAPVTAMAAGIALLIVYIYFENREPDWVQFACPFATIAIGWLLFLLVFLELVAPSFMVYIAMVFLNVLVFVECFYLLCKL